MKRSLLVMLTALALLQLACYKDKGNYDYHPAVAPGIELDTLYKVALGDTLIIKPTITTTDPHSRFGLTWRISIPKQVRDTTLTGSTLAFLFTLDPDVYPVRLTVTDSSNGMQYFRNFKIQGVTPFSSGALVLSLENNIGQLSFVQPDSTVIPRIYKTLNQGDLTGKPLQVINLVKQQIYPVPALGYWITTDDPNDGGVHIGTNTLLKSNTLRTNFFTLPPTAKAGYMESTDNGVLRGVINGKLYEGAWQTYYGSNIYGYFGEPVNGDYELYSRVIGSVPLILGYDIKNKQFTVFTNMGSLSFVGNNYQVTDLTPFDPKHIQLDLSYFHMNGGSSCYAVGKGTDGVLYELGLNMLYKGYVEITPLYKRPFPQPSLITPATKWTGTVASVEVHYFSSGDKIYSYTPSNQQIIPLTTDFGGKNVTMLKLSDDDHTLIAGVEGTVYWLDVNTGKFGDVIKKIDGIPGAPVDVVERQ